MFPMVDKIVIGLLLDENHFRMEPTIQALMEIAKDIPKSEDPASTPDVSGDENLARALQEQFHSQLGVTNQQVLQDEAMAKQLDQSNLANSDLLSDEALAWKLQRRYDPYFSLQPKLPTSGPASQGVLPGLAQNNIAYDMQHPPPKPVSNDLFPDINLQDIEKKITEIGNEVDQKITASVRELSDSMKSAWANLSNSFMSPDPPKPDPQPSRERRFSKPGPELFIRTDPDDSDYYGNQSIPQTLVVSVSDSDETEFSDDEPLLPRTSTVSSTH